MLKRIFLGALLTLLLTNVVALANLGSWIRYPENPVLEPGPPGSWDALGIRAPCVLKDNGMYMMWYNSEYHVDGHDYIGFASSGDGIHWEKYFDNPVLSPESGWEWGRVTGASVIKDGGIYKMWYTGRQGIGTGPARIGYATSDDGVNWNKYVGNPVLDRGEPGEWDDDLVGNPCVIKDGSIYKMWYTGRYSGGGNRIGYATSDDGVNWNKHPHAVLDKGSPGEIDAIGVAQPTVILEDGKYHMWYIAVKDDPGSTHTIAYANSDDGIEWTKATENPVLEPNPENSWESKHVAVGQVIEDEETLKMWYTGRASNTGPMSLGYAEYVQQPDFEISASPESQKIEPGMSTTYTLTITSVGNFDSEVTFTEVRIRPIKYPSSTGWISPLFDPPSVTPPPNNSKQSILTISTGRNAEPNIYEITITASAGETTHQVMVNLTIAEFELFIEIDYMRGHKPNSSVLSYIEIYYLQRSIDLKFVVDQEIPPTEGTTIGEFWLYELVYNDLGDDAAWRTGTYDPVYYSKWKWVLYVNDAPGYGFCDVPGGMDGTELPFKSTRGGNYICISDGQIDGLADEWADKGATREEIETVLLMHELGHGVGILRLRLDIWDEDHDESKRDFVEAYDRDTSSVMAYTDKYDWSATPGYSRGYWANRNMKFYEI